MRAVDDIASLAVSTMPDLDAAGADIPAHRYASFILSELLRTPGQLIDEAHLAALLGVDLSCEAWPFLRDEVFPPAAYTGPFASAFPRWWTAWVEDWWRHHDSARRGIRSYDASERVQAIERETRRDGLIPALPMEPGYSARFSTICEVYRCPIDPVDGLRVSPRDPRPWQMHRYVSAKAVHERKHKPRWTIHAADVPRAQRLQQGTE